jgi:hypothetical protein
MRLNIVWAAIASLLATTAWAKPIAFEMGTAADKDIIYESGKGSKAAPFGDKTEADQCFVEDAHADGNVTAKGLPKNRKVASAQAELGDYQLLPYNGKNVIELCARADSPAESHKISVPKHAYKMIGLLVAGVHGDVSFTIKLHYADGSEAVVWWEADDWYDEADALRASQKAVINKMDRARAKDGAIDKAAHYSLFEFTIVPDSRKILDAITIGNDPNRWPEDADRWGAVFAISGATAD